MAFIDMKELDDLDKQKALNQLMAKLNDVEKSIKKITSAARGLRTLEEQGKSVFAMFDERENFKQKLFGISTTELEGIEYWDE